MEGLLTLWGLLGIFAIVTCVFVSFVGIAALGLYYLGVVIWLTVENYLRRRRRRRLQE